MSLKNKPKKYGFRMPAEWEPHEATWLAWPHNPETWPGRMEAIPKIWVEMIQELLPGEKVCLLVNEDSMEKEAIREIRRAGIPMRHLFFYRIATDDCWLRDTGPTFIVNREGEVATVQWIFNAWGGKYPPWDQDSAITQKISEQLKLRSFQPRMVLEGGAIDVNGRGTLLTTESSLLHPNRNPDRSKEEIENRLRDYLGVEKILWLKGGIVGDDTDGHVDDVARFVGPTTVVCALEENKEDENYASLQENYALLKKMTDQDEKPLEIIPLPMPRAIEYQGARLPASYANFYIANRVVLVPTFEDPNDEKALSTIQKLFPRRKVVGIRSNDLVIGLGALHCITQQQPLSSFPSS